MVKKIEKVKDELLEHNFDGIQELDNELPPWWLILFYISIIFGVIYMLYFHVFAVGPSSEEEYLNEMAKAEELYKKSAPSGEVQGVAALTDEKNLAEGKTIFETSCFPCHGKLGEGGIGPNLTDKYWIHGGHFDEIVYTITNGAKEKGMIAWNTQLNSEQILQVASYVVTLQGTNPPNAKAPQGELDDEIEPDEK